MKIYHVSEESCIKIFKPRKPDRHDLWDSPPLVWAVDEKRLPNFFTPRDCPRVTYHIPDRYDKEIPNGLFSGSSRHVVAIESAWFQRMKEQKLYLYELDKSGFYLQDDIAGYYVSEKETIPKSVIPIDDLFQALINRKVELRVIDNLIDLSERVRNTSLNWSMCRMRNVQPKANCGTT